MAPAESISVPSQSNTSRSKRRGMGFIQLPEKRRKIVRQRRLEGEPLAAVRVRDSRLGRMQEHSFERLFLQLFIELEITVLGVARQRKAKMREMHADLVGAPGLQFR